MDKQISLPDIKSGFISSWHGRIKADVGHYIDTCTPQCACEPTVYKKYIYCRLCTLFSINKGSKVICFVSFCVGIFIL